MSEQFKRIDVEKSHVKPRPAPFNLCPVFFFFRSIQIRWKYAVISGF